MTIHEYIVYSCICIGLVLFAGLMSGLTVGLMSLADLSLEMKLRSDDEEHRAMASNLIPLINKHH
jgi:metal transporter CNNM